MIHVMLPVQYTPKAGRFLSDAHRRLMAAVLQSVVDDCRGGSPYRRVAHDGSKVDARSVREAMAYVASTDRTWPFSFENLCEALGIDAAAVRVALDGDTHGRDRVDPVPLVCVPSAAPAARVRPPS